MATIEGAVRVPLYINVGLYGAGALFFSVWSFMRMTHWPLKRRFHTQTSTDVLMSGFEVCVLNAIASLALLFGHLVFQRTDLVYVSYVHLAMWAFTYAILGYTLSLFLSVGRVWAGHLWKIFAFGVGTLIAFSFMPDGMSWRYLWYAVHVAAFVYGLLGIAHYRCRHDFHATLVLAVVGPVWLFGFSLPFLLGHAASQVISFAVEMWWMSAAAWIGQLGLSVYIACNLYNLGESMQAYFQRRASRMFLSRLVEAVEPGWEQYGLYEVTEKFLVETSDAESGNASRAAAPDDDTCSATVAGGVEASLLAPPPAQSRRHLGYTAENQHRTTTAASSCSADEFGFQTIRADVNTAASRQQRAAAAAAAAAAAPSAASTRQQQLQPKPNRRAGQQ